LPAPNPPPYGPNCSASSAGQICYDAIPLTPTRDLFAQGHQGKYAIGAFTVDTWSCLKAIIEACEEEKKLRLLQSFQGRPAKRPPRLFEGPD